MPILAEIAMSEALLSLSSASVRYGAVEALRNVSLEVFEGEIVTVIGANGAGKTTLLRCLSRLISVSTGSLRFAGRDISTTPAHDLVPLGLAHVPEGRRVFGRLSVRENLELGGYTVANAAEISDRIDQAIGLFPILGQRAQQLAGTLSGGEQQMLAIARALISRPKLILMDEPSMGIAPLIVTRIFDTIAALNAGGITIVLVEQNAQRALRIANRAYVLETGEITLSGSGKDLLADNRVREAYLGC